MEISTKSIELKNLISFLRSLKNSPELFILERIIKKGYLIADIKLEFDTNGNIKKNYKINGFIKDTKLSFLKKYKIDKLNLIFNYERNNLKIEGTTFSLNDLRFQSKEILLKRAKDEFIIKGNVYHDEFDFDKKKLELFIKPYFPDLDLKKLKFSSENIFSFKINKRYQIKNLDINSEMTVNKFLLANNLKLANFFPNSKENFLLTDNKLSINYKNDNLSINGKGNILYQEKRFDKELISRIRKNSKNRKNK